jgi:hypothetical protein
MYPALAFLGRFRALAVGLAASLLGGIGLAGCNVGDDGPSPPTKSLYFPTGLAVSPGRTALYVANSDFDLQYNGGTVQLFDLPTLRERVFSLQGAFAEGQGASAACAATGGVNLEPVLYPGPCAPLPASDFVKRSVIIGAFASDLILTHVPEEKRAGAMFSHARMFVSVRGDPSVTYLDIVDDRDPDAAGPSQSRCGSDTSCLQCGAGDDLRCDDAHRIGVDPTDNVRRLTLPQEPIALAADPSGETIVVAHQTGGRASLVVNSWTGTRETPALESLLSGLAERPTELAAVPPLGLVEEVTRLATTETAIRPLDYRPGFLLTFRGVAEIDLLRYELDDSASPSRPFLAASAATAISAVASGVDSRGIAVDDRERKACERACAREIECLARCADIPLGMYIAHRTPSSLLIGEVRTTLVERDQEDSGASDPANRWASAYDTLTIRDAVPLATGASRVEIGDIVGRDGALHTRVFAVAFDSGLAFSYDPETRRIDGVIRTGRGPHAIAFDTGTREGTAGPEPYSFMYIAHFTDSYIGVVDLDARKPSTFGSMILTLGKPVPPRESQ